MRIIAGKFRGRNIKANPGKTTRPILDRAKQMLFDRLEQDLPGARVLDAFSGTGSLGLEALSRGAATCVFIEKDHQAHRLLRENVAHLGVEDQTVCWRNDGVNSSYRPKGVPDMVPFDIVFYDPPYPLAIEQFKAENTPLYKAMERLAADDVTAPEISLLILRLPIRLDPVLPPVWMRSELELKVASMKILFFEKHGDSDAAPDAGE
ncbi:RsmD family RNA methyltransferase [Rubinisphaera margarita]|uniref:RsmD family RNA methyltransferase n=1 Tax=Rubinisphaera margarita TaxID=2909586 RepID=UPI001EE8E920|nr:RsmD family RNA methyltransferase [Rubinisphaera margarita]MCG6155348.1 RsmD family RNA methyltransferase [Rubinisphaera margarita]